MKEIIIVGADISKATIDLYIKPFENAMCIENNPKGFKQWLKIVKQLSKSEVLVVMEHTGRYSRKLESF